jgi:hypothetical protein
VRRPGVHGGDERALVRRRDAGLDGDREEALASSVTSTGGRRRVSDWEENLLLLQSDRHWGPPMLTTDDATVMTELAIMPTAARTTAMTVCSVSSTDALCSMMRRRWALSLNIVAYCFLTVA